MKPQPSPDEQEHLAVQQALPWYAAGTLPAGEQAMAARHLETCAACRADLAFERRLHAAGPAADALPPGLDPDAALARLMPRLDGASPAVRPALPRSGAAGRGNWRHWLAALGTGGWRNWALAAQCAVIAGMGVLLWPGDGAPGGQDAAYRALGSGAVAAPDVVVMFEPGMRLEHMQQLLQGSGARIVDGPTVTGAYLVDVERARRAQLLATLRADAAVRLAEPLDAGAQP